MQFAHICKATGQVSHPMVRSVNEPLGERWGAGVETQKNVRGEIGGWGHLMGPTPRR